jgi:hypothetical protein
MAIKKKASIGVIEFVHPDDDAINTDLDEDTGKPYSDIEKYRETWDFEKYCVLRENQKPTIFKLNFSVPYKKQIAIKNASLGGFGKGEEAGFRLGTHSNQVVRTILIDIINPDDMDEKDKIRFKKEGNGLASEDTMGELEDLGIVDDIYSFWMANKSEPDHLKKR